MKHSETYNKKPHDEFTCTTTTYQEADISLPLELMPYTNVGDIKTECCGDPHISIEKDKKCGCKNGCNIVITQKIKMKIPVEYGTTANTGEIIVACK